MSLPHLEWRYVGSRVFPSATVASVLDNVYSLGTTGSYVDGTTRIQGTGSAWSFTGKTFVSSSVTEAVWCTSPSGSTDQTILMAGSAINPPAGPAMASPDTAVINRLMVNMAMSSGSVNWTDNQPISGATNFGYWKAWPTTAGTGSVHMWESKEVLAIIVANSTGNSTYGFIAGAIIDPESTDIVDSEADGRLYGILTSGGAAIQNNFNTTNASTIFLGSHGTANDVNHGGIFVPRGSTILTCRRLVTVWISDSASYRTRSGKFYREPINIHAQLTPTHLLGRLRDITLCADGRTGQKLTEGVETIGYLFGTSTTTVSEQIFLEHS